MGELQQFPKPAEHGKFLQKTSVAGEKVNFVVSTAASLGVLNLAAAGAANNFDFGTFGANFNYIIDGNVYPWQSIVAWQYANFYIDGMGVGPGFDDDLYRYGSNVSGTTAPLRKPMLINIFPHHIYNPDLVAFTSSHTNIWYCQNLDSSSHTVGLDSAWKYIVTGDYNA